MGLKINFKFEILGILVQNPHIQQAFFLMTKKVSLILLKISSYIVQTKLISPILENLRNNFLMGLKNQFSF